MKAGEINHEEHEGHGEFRFVLSLCGTLAIWGARAASPQCSAACRAQNPVGKLPTVAGKLPALPGETDANGPEKQRLFTITPRIIVEDAILVTCVGIALGELRARRDTSC